MDLEGYSFGTDTHVLLGQITFKILVNGYAHSFGKSDDTISSGFTVSHMHYICQHVQNSKIVFHYQHGFFLCDLLYELGTVDTLVYVQIWTYLIEEIEIGIFSSTCNNCNPL